MLEKKKFSNSLILDEKEKDYMKRKGPHCRFGGGFLCLHIEPFNLSQIIITYVSFDVEVGKG